QQTGGGHRWQRRGVHTASGQSGALTGRAWMTGSRWPPASAASPHAYIASDGRDRAPLAVITAAALPPSDAQTKTNRLSRSSTVWISAQPVSRFAPLEASATVHPTIPHAPRGSQHLRLLNLRVHERRVNPRVRREGSTASASAAH